MAFLRSNSRDTTRGQMMVQGVLVLVVLALFCGVIALKLNGSFSRALPVTAELPTAGGAIRSGGDVKLRGMVIGSIREVSGDARQVRLALEIDRAHAGQVPRGVRARVLPASVFGTSYVDLVVPRGAQGGPSLRAGDVIAQDTSQATIELQDALDSIDELVDALGPAELAGALHTLSTALDGRGEALGRSFDTLDAYTARLEPLLPRLRGDLRLLAVNLNAVARNAPELLDAGDSTLTTLDRLVSRREKITALLDGGALLMGDTKAFLARHDRTFLRALDLSVTLVDALYDERAGLRDTLLSTGDTSTKLLTVLEDGYARVEGYIHGAGPDDYTRADCPRYGSHAGGNCG